MKDVDSIISQLEQQSDAIGRAISALRGISGSATTTVKKRGRPGRPPGPRPGTPSAAVPAPPTAKKRRLSSEGRKRIVEALKKRWAVKKAAQKKALAKRPAVKKAAKKAVKKAAVKAPEAVAAV